MSGMSGRGHSVRMRRRGALLVSGAALLGALAAGSPAAADDSESRDYRGAAASLSFGDAHVCTIAATGAVWCWGTNNSWVTGAAVDQGDIIGDQPGELPRDLRPIVLGQGRTARVVSSGRRAACAIRDDAMVMCWGEGEATGVPTSADSGTGNAPLPPQRVPLGTGRHAKSLSVGATSTCVVLDDRSVKCWGENLFGQLGLGDKRTRFGAAQLGDALGRADLGGPVARVSVGDGFACGLLVNGSVKCWGRNDRGQLGLSDRRNRGNDPGEMGAALPVVPLGRAATAVTVGASHACALLDNGKVRCWGSNATSALGSATGGSVKLPTNSPVVGVSAGEQHTCAVTNDGAVWCWGSSPTGQVRWKSTATETCVPQCTSPALDAPGRRAIAVSAGGDGTCAILDDRSVRCWSRYSGYGQIGEWPADARPPQVPLPGPVVRPDTAPPSARPDLAIKVGTSGFDGNDIYDPPTIQQKNGPVRPGGRTTYVVRVQNDAPFSDRMLLTSRIANKVDGTTSPWTVAVFNGSTDITAAIRGAGWTTPALAPGATLDLRIEITLPAGSRDVPPLTGTVTGTSQANPFVQDRVVLVSQYVR